MVSLMTHQFIVILFLLIVPLPIISYVKSRTGQPLPAAKLWKILVMLANIALIISLITGFIIFPTLSDYRVWVSIILVLAIGAFLGIFSKQLKLYRLAVDVTTQQKHLKKMGTVGFGYIVVIIITFVFMSLWYHL